MQQMREIGRRGIEGKRNRRKGDRNAGRLEMCGDRHMAFVYDIPRSSR
jgi:hypothetical protein